MYRISMSGPLWYHHTYMSRTGFESPSADDASYEADALLTKPPQLDSCYIPTLASIIDM